MTKTVLITGGTGSVGKAFCKLAIREGWKVHVLTRNKKRTSKDSSLKYFFWNPEHKEIDEKCFENVSSIVHLAGDPIFGMLWTKSRKKSMKSSRIDSIDFLFQRIPSWQRPYIESLISASAIGIYKANTSEILVEDSTKGNDFLAEVCLKWEDKIKELAEINAIREVRFRNGMVFSSTEGVYTLLNKLGKLGLLSTPGNGKQLVPWVHVEDVAFNLLRAITHKSYTGAYNMVAPEYNNMEEITEKILKNKGNFRIMKEVPESLLKFALGEMSTLILNSYLVKPDRLLKLGYSFKYPSLDLAFANLRTKN